MNELRPQYVNLLRQQAGWRSRILRARVAGLALLTLAAGLMILTGVAAISVRRGQQSAELVAATSGEQTAGLLAVDARYRENDSFSQLQQRIRHLQRIVERQDIVLLRLRATDINPATSISTRLAAISQARIDGVWLTQMNLTAEPASLRLSGVAMDAELLPRYLAQLGSKVRLGVHQLDNLSVDRTVNDPRAASAGAVGFSMLLLNTDEGGPS